jgi:hypothetical protein
MPTRAACHLHQHPQGFDHRSLNVAHGASADRAETAFAMGYPAVARH